MPGTYNRVFLDAKLTSKVRTTKSGCSFVVGFPCREAIERIHCVSVYPAVVHTLRDVVAGSQLLVVGSLRTQPRARIAVDEALFLGAPGEGGHRKEPDHEVQVPGHMRTLADGRQIRVSAHTRYKRQGARRIAHR